MLLNTKEYLSIVDSIKTQIASARQRAILNANQELLMLYWNIGKIINKNTAYGNKFIANLARDIKADNPHLRGFSERNLYYMAKFARFYQDIEILQQVAAKLSWRHHQTLLNRIKDYAEMIWYAKQNIENGWSSNVLDMQIDRELYKRQVLADKTTNFKGRLPAPQSELAQQTLKDPYIFDFVEYQDGMIERNVEDALVKHITKFLLELGSGFSFVGQQYHLEIAEKDFYIDLLFYNLKLRCYVVIELKQTDFKPEYAGKLNFYASAVDDVLKQPTENPTIGILLCRKKNKVIAEYALRNINSPISVNEFKLLDKLPKEYENILPTVKDIEKRLKLPGTLDNK
ncbi:MAG: PDDEXK nuclease domain-containing protein [Candidatus Margulisbacteria bacterium]|jgi:predicted nuclease of restriction endonuclease-like (RecB) superfamily|nr:PDDEXK nuclease domain-containing protein [Candidatus Margulisiibacteriota bacterium]